MSAGWAGGAVRAAGLARRRMGRAAARHVAVSASRSAARAALRGGPYERAAAVATLAEAQRTIAGTVLWQMRVLAGWLPRDGVRIMRLLAAAFEVANTGEHLRVLMGDDAQPRPYFTMGALATAWPRLAQTRTPEELRAALAGSAWGDPGGEPADLVRGMRYRYLERLASLHAPAPAWAAGAVALMVAGDRFAGGREPPRRAVTALLGPKVLEAASVTDLASRLPRAARWALAGVAGPDDLWWAGGRWWNRVDRDGHLLLATAGLGPGAPLGAVAVLAADAWRVRAALAAAGAGTAAVEAYDLLAGDAPDARDGSADAVA